MHRSICVAPLVGARIEILFHHPKIPIALVAPLVGARIEIGFSIIFSSLVLSLPSWERGLKLH